MMTTSARGSVVKTSALHMRSAFAGLSRAVGFLGAVVSTDAQVTLAPGRRPVVDLHNILSETGRSRRKWRDLSRRYCHVRRAGGRIGGRRDRLHAITGRSALPPSLSRRDHQPRRLAVPRVQPQPAGCRVASGRAVQGPASQTKTERPFITVGRSEAAVLLS
jgi:hypothetical protein